MPPDEAAEWLEQAETLLAIRRLQEARVAFDRAEAAGAEADRCSGGRWFTAMLEGNFEAAWLESDAIRARGAADAHRFWNGEQLQGARVMVRCLHGFGDSVQMLRYAPRLQGIASRVIFELPPRLLPLAPFFHGIDHAISWEEKTPVKMADWDVQVEVTELPYLFRTTAAELPIASRYLELPSRLVQSAAESMGRSERPRIGYVWAGGEWNPDRSVTLAVFASLLANKSVEHWSLQGGSAADQARELIKTGEMRDTTAVCGDGLLALAATIANLDLVITVDTLAAHLAGALGKPAWVLLQYAADWRWMTAREDSPWYPEMRLFRQSAPGNWRGVIDAVQDAIECGVFERTA